MSPSVERKVKKDVVHFGINTVLELCTKNEEELHRIPSFNDELISNLGEALDEYGLHFGMSEAELDDYMDREYFKTHGMSKSFNRAKSIEKMTFENVATTKTAKQADDDSGDELVPHRPLVEVKEEPFVKSSYFVASFLGAMTGCMLILFVKLLFTLITDIF